MNNNLISQPRAEYPRPQFQRKEWVNLNGVWDFAFDDRNRGLIERWYDSDIENDIFSCHITVPFVYEASLSGIGTSEQHDIVWYRTKFEISQMVDSQCVILHFGAVDYHADVFLNGTKIAEHDGGQTPFSVDISPFLSADMTQVLVVRVFDPLDGETIARGKQFWGANPKGIWYTRSTGIWQTVWLETVHTKHLTSAHFQSNINTGLIEVKVCSESAELGDTLAYRVMKEDELIAAGQLAWCAATMRWKFDYTQNHVFRTGAHGDDNYLWSPENPNLFDVYFELIDGKTGKVCDEVKSYFGIRKVEVRNGAVYLNNRPYYQKLVLDQGYWPDGLLTAPTDEDYCKDIMQAKSLGFNGCRKHQKVEDPRFLYWADKIGYLVWEENASAPIINEKTMIAIADEWSQIIERDYSHPCIIVWVPLNESWGVSEIYQNSNQQHYAQSLYHLIKALDDSRLVESNDGWEQTETDICTVHNYMHGEANDEKQYAEFCRSISDAERLTRYTVSGRAIFASGFTYNNQPIILSECGGITFTEDNQGWGYSSVQNSDEFVSEYRKLIEAIYASKSLCGFCYTQLTDVEQETNGLITYDREPKCEVERIREINESFHMHSVPC